MYTVLLIVLDPVDVSWSVWDLVDRFSPDKAQVHIVWKSVCKVDS